MHLNASPLPLFECSVVQCNVQHGEELCHSLWHARKRNLLQTYISSGWTTVLAANAHLNNEADEAQTNPPWPPWPPRLDNNVQTAGSLFSRVPNRSWTAAAAAATGGQLAAKSVKIYRTPDESFSLQFTFFPQTPSLLLLLPPCSFNNLHKSFMSLAACSAKSLRVFGT